MKIDDRFRSRKMLDTQIREPNVHAGSSGYRMCLTALSVPLLRKALEQVETNLLRDPQNRVLRYVPVAQVVQRVVNLADILKETLPFSADENLVVSMYTWHGCMYMAKLLRRVHNVPGGGQDSYTLKMRQEGYAHIQQQWVQSEEEGNVWVRYGVSLARPMEQGRKKQNFDLEVHENWIPKDSPYWES